MPAENLECMDHAYLAATSSLTQELNLARRACWQSSESVKTVTTKKEYMTVNSSANEYAETIDSCKSRISIKESFPRNYGATNLKEVERQIFTKSCDCFFPSLFSNQIEKPSQLYDTNMLYSFQNASMRLFHKLKAHSISWLLMLITTLAQCLKRDFTMRSIMSKGYNQKASKRPSSSGQIKSTLSFAIILLLSASIGLAESRPNRTTSSVDSNVVAGSSNTLEHIGSSEIVSMQLEGDMSTLSFQSKRAADVPQTALPDMVHEKAQGGEHPDEGYPVAKVEFDRVKTPFIIGIWILSASIAKIGFHMTPKLHKIFPESCLLIVVGVIIGVVLYFATDVEVSPLTPNTFFFYMLPPIILDAGYFMPNRLFFDNLGTILLMAVVGTIFNIATIGASLWACGLNGLYGRETPLLETFLFSSVISAVDPVAVLAVFEEIHVNEILYIVVFGESLLNDAVTVVLYHMMEAYNVIGVQNITVGDIASGVTSFFVVAIGGTVIGVIWGFLTGLVTRFTDNVRVIEPIFIFVMAYLAYLNAEIFHMSGILAITFCGITMKNYVESNISQKSHTTVKYALKMLSSSSETIIFMFLGVATVNRNHQWNTWFVLLTIVFCSVFRIIGVIILTAMANRFRLHKLSRVDQFVMSYGGLRGAVAFALVLLIDESHVRLQPMFVTTTIAVIYFTVFLQGITIKPLVKFLNVKRASKRKPTMNERIHERFMDHLMAGIEDIVGKTGNYNVRDKFKRFDNKFIRPYLIRDLKGAEPKIIETYSKLTMRDAIEVMRRNPSTIGQMSGTESMSALFRTYTNNYLSGSPSLTNLETCSRNLDMHELDYNPSKKDLTDAKIHHLLAEELKPYRRHRRLSYSRHAVDDRDLSTQVNYKMHMNIRRMVNDRKHHKRSKRGANKGEALKKNHVSFHDLQQNGTSKQLSHAAENPNGSPHGGQHEDWDDGLTFTAKTTLGEASGIPEEDKTAPVDSDCERRVSTPTAIESQLPWKRTEDETEDGGAIKQNEFPAWASNKEYLAYNSPSATFLGGLSKPKQPKSVIGLFRRESSGSGSIIGTGTGTGDTVGSDSSGTPAISGTSHNYSNTVGKHTEKRSASICGVAPVDGAPSHSGPFPVTASHRRNTRRGSMLELSGDVIPEETSNCTKSLSEHEKWISNPGGSGGNNQSPTKFGHTNSGSIGKLNRKITTNSAANIDSNGCNSGREPLLPKSTPKAQIRRMNQVSSLLSSSNSSSPSDDGGDGDNDDNDDYDDDEEDVDIYSDEHIVNTSNFLKRKRKGDSSSSART